MDNHCPFTANEAIDVIENVAGIYQTQRRAHAKGIGFEATFRPNGAATLYTYATHLQKTEIPAVVRFSHSSPKPDPTERFVPVKGMAVQFQLPGGEITNLTMATVPVFITKTPEAFIRLLQVFKREPLSLADKWSVLKNDSEFKVTARLLKNFRPPKSFATGTYYSIHAFHLVNDEGKRQAVKFEWHPLDREKVQKTADMVSHRKDDVMEEEILSRLQSSPIQFNLVIQLAQQGDQTDDPTQQWQEDREKITIGTLTLHSRRTDDAEGFVFDPTVVIGGIECSDDPVLQFRSSAYAESAKRRKNESL